MASDEFKDSEDFGQETSFSAPKELRLGTLSLRLFRRDFRFWINAVLNRWYWIVIAGVVASAAIFSVMTFFVKNVYEARAMLLRVERDMQKSSPLDAVKPFSNDVIIDMIRSRANMEKVRTMLGNPSVTLAQLYHDTSITKKKTKDNIFVITAQAKDPVLAANLANYMAEVFVEDYSQKLKEMLMQNFYSFRQNYEKLKIAIDEQQNDLNDFLARLDVNSLSDAKNRTTSQINAIEARLLNERTSVKAAQSKIDELEKSLAETPVEVLKETETYDEDKKTIEAKEFELASLRMQYTDENPAVQNALFTLTELRRRAGEKEKQEKKPTKVVMQINPARRLLETTIIQIRSELTAATINVKNLENMLTELMTRDAELSRAMPQYDQMVAALDSKRSVLHELEKSLRIQDMMQDSNPSDISLQEAALVPTSSIGKKRFLFSAAGGILAAGFAAIFLLLAECVNLRIRSREDLASALGLTPIGVLPELGKDNHSDYYSALQKFVEELRLWGEKKQTMVLIADSSPEDMMELIRKSSDILDLRDIRILTLEFLPAPDDAQCAHLANDYLYGISDELPDPDKQNSLYFKMDEMLYLMPPEQEKFRNFRKVLEKYSLIFILVNNQDMDRRLFDILCEASDKVLFSTRYETESKVHAEQNIAAANKFHDFSGLYGVIYGMPQKIFKEIN